MSLKIRTKMVHKDKKFLGWKVYLNGKKYPQKPRDYYENMLEERAISLALKSGGIDIPYSVGSDKFMAALARM